MRKAFIVVAVVALVFVAMGAVNHSLAFDIDYGVGAVYGVSAFWIMLAAAAVLFVTGLVAAALARAAAVAAQRKLEGELETTYKRLRQAEGELMLAASSKPSPATPSREARAADETSPLPAAEAGEVTSPLPSTDEAADDEAAADDDETVVLPGTSPEGAQPRPDDP
jgi:hypothetical protein